MLINVNQSLSTSTNKQKELLLSFFQSMNSENTVKSYMNDISKFQDYLRLNHREVRLNQVRQYHVSAYKQYLLVFGGRNNGPSTSKTIIRKLTALSVFYKFLKENNEISCNPVTKVKKPVLSSVNHTIELSQIETDKLLSQVDTSKGSGKLHFAICNCLFFRGMRRGEVISLRIKDFYSYEGLFVLSYIKKGGVRVLKKIPIKVAEAILDWIRWCEDNNYSLNEEDFLFRPVKNNSTFQLNKKLSPTTLDYIVKKYASLAGIDKRVSAHTGRSSFICHYLDKFPAYIVQREVDHKDLSTTLAYDQRRKSLKESIVDD